VTWHTAAFELYKTEFPKRAQPILNYFKNGVVNSATYHAFLHYGEWKYQLEKEKGRRT
jgi:hypothetical protein